MLVNVVNFQRMFERPCAGERCARNSRSRFEPRGCVWRSYACSMSIPGRSVSQPYEYKGRHKARAVRRHRIVTCACYICCAAQVRVSGRYRPGPVRDTYDLSVACVMIIHVRVIIVATSRENTIHFTPTLRLNNTNDIIPTTIASYIKTSCTKVLCNNNSKLLLIDIVRRKRVWKRTSLIKYT